MDPAFLRSKAARCRYLADIATNHEMRQALDELAQDLEDAAAAIEKGRPPEHDGTDQGFDQAP
jgi:hypothetical protein